MDDSSSSITSFVVGVTGGIGSGKSTVCSRFTERYGIPVVDADIVAREVVEPGQPALEELVDIFGREVLDEQGALDRPGLKRIVFDDANKRRQLEQVLHPRIRTRMRQHLSQVTTAYCLLGIPLLAEGGRHDLIDRVLVVDCPESLQVARVMQRDNLTEREVLAIMQTQATRAQRLAIADDVINNDGDTEVLETRVQELHETYLALSQQKSAVSS